MLVNGLVSTIIPVYNRPALLREAVSSVLGQTHRPIEIIIVDDGSTDETRGVAADLRRGHPEILVLHQENHGPGTARQLGLNNATGEFVQFLDSDDLLSPRKFESQVSALKDHPDHAACYGWTSQYEISGPRSQAPAKWTGRKISTLFPSMLALRWWDTSTPLYRHSRLRAIGPWTSLRQEEDWEYDCRLAATGAKIVQIECLVSETRFVGEETLSSGGSLDQLKLRDRCAARLAILGHASNAKVDPEVAEMQSFLKASFLVARQSAAGGLEKESRELVEALHKASPRFLSALFLNCGHIIATADILLGFAQRPDSRKLPIN